MKSAAGHVSSDRHSPLSAEPGFRWGPGDWAIVFAASLASHLYNGIEYGVRAHATQLTRVFKLNDPTLYAGDLFVDSLDQYCSFFWVGVAWAARLIGMIRL